MNEKSVSLLRLFEDRLEEDKRLTVVGRFSRPSAYQENMLIDEVESVSSDDPHHITVKKNTFYLAPIKEIAWNFVDLRESGRSMMATWQSILADVGTNHPMKVEDDRGKFRFKACEVNRVGDDISRLFLPQLIFSEVIRRSAHQVSLSYRVISDEVLDPDEYAGGNIPELLVPENEIREVPILHLRQNQFVVFPNREAAQLAVDYRSYISAGGRHYMGLDDFAMDPFYLDAKLKIKKVPEFSDFGAVFLEMRRPAELV